MGAKLSCFLFARIQGFLVRRFLFCEFCRPQGSYPELLILRLLAAVRLRCSACLLEFLLLRSQVRAEQSTGERRA